MIKRLSLVAVFVFIVLVFSSCGSAPEQIISKNGSNNCGNIDDTVNSIHNICLLISTTFLMSKKYREQKYEKR